MNRTVIFIIAFVLAAFSPCPCAFGSTDAGPVPMITRPYPVFFPAGSDRAIFEEGAGGRRDMNAGVANDKAWIIRGGRCVPPGCAPVSRGLADSIMRACAVETCL